MKNHVICGGGHEHTLAWELAQSPRLEIMHATPDNVSSAHKEKCENLCITADVGVNAIIQPGGSMRDQEVITAADEHDMTMVFTGIRYFRH